MENAAQDLQQGYDKVAAQYAASLFHELDDKPLDRQLLNRFIQEVKGHGAACDMGCGPGQVARYLRDHGLDEVTGVDLSPEMVRQAQRLNPMIPFAQGDMLSLQVPDHTWAGIAAFYSIIHVPRAQVTDALRELRRVLKPGGLLLLAFHVDAGEETVHLQEFFGQTVSIDFIFYRVEDMSEYLREAGFEQVEVIQRRPYPDVEYQGPRAYVFARRPGG